MNTRILTAACLLIASPALAQSLGEKTGVDSALGIAPSTADFVREAAISDIFEIQSSQLAEQKDVAAPVKTFAQQMITDHTKTSTELKSIVQTNELKASIPTDLDSSHAKMLDTLRGLNGGDFTKQYVSDQVSGHKDAVSLFQRYAKSGTDTSLKDWAGKTEPTLEHHLQMAQDLNK